MNTEGHESIAKEAGIPFLQQTFELNKKGTPRLAAFYFGNWLTDVSQLVDPVAYSDAAKSAKERIDNIIDEYASTVFIKSTKQIGEAIGTAGQVSSNLPGGVFQPQSTILKRLADLINLDQPLQNAKNRLHASIDYWILDGNDERTSRLARIMRTAFRLKGYFKFAHPQAIGEQPPMNTQCFFEIFDRLYTQYYPHEHLDRPEVFPAKSPREYVIKKDSYTRAIPQFLPFDMYAYLRDDIVITAGLLDEIDREWASKTFEPYVNVNDNDVEWNYQLAKLGHALHAVEDFFAHSNFIEQAALIMGRDYLPWNAQYLDYNLFYKRLKRYMPASYVDWRQYPEEDTIVTGYFDTIDTIIALAHAAEEMFGLTGRDPLRDARQIADTVGEFYLHPEKPIFEAEQIINDSLEFLDDPEKALENNDNRVAQKLKDKYEPDLVKLRRPEVTRQIMDQILKEFPLFENVDPRIKNDIINYVVELNRGIIIAKYSISGYKAIKSLNTFFTDPWAWIAEFLSSKLKNYIKESIVYYAHERFYDSVGRGRIGCHSLLAKDHGTEWLYEPMRNCAMAVHWYILKTMVRWRDKEFREVALISPEQKWVNWLELLEYFLRHPVADQDLVMTKVSVPVSIIHVVKDGDMLSNLANRYRTTALHPKEFSWETIADSNFNTYDLPKKQRKDVVNQILKDNHWGYPVRLKPNFAFNPGLHIIIPDQKKEIAYAQEAPSNKKWFEEVIEKSWVVFRGYPDPISKKSVPGIKHHTLVFFKNLSELDAQVKQGQKLREVGENSYTAAHANANG